jgi:hypothetical protein
MQAVAVERYKFIAESGVTLAMTRLFGRAPRSHRIVDTIPQHYGPNVTMIGALSLQGLDAVTTGEGATDGDVFRAEVEQVLGPSLQPGDVGIIDNLRAHKVAGIRKPLRSAVRRYGTCPPIRPTSRRSNRAGRRTLRLRYGA